MDKNVKDSSQITTTKKSYFFDETKKEALVNELKECLNLNFPKNGPGCCLGVFLNGESTIILCHGYENILNKTKITSDTIFDMASVSKHFTAAAILLLQREKLLNLTDDIKEWFPELKNYKTHRPILIQDLIHMVSGLPECLEDNSIFDKTNQTKVEIGRAHV